MMETVKITQSNEETFFNDVNIGLVFTYSMAYFPQDIEEIAKKHSLIVEYCPPGSPEYKKHGCHTMKVTKIIHPKSTFSKRMLIGACNF